MILPSIWVGRMDTEYQYNLREDMPRSEYQVLVHAVKESGSESYALISFLIGEPVTENITLADQVFDASIDSCFGASQNIEVAGDGKTVEFQNGSLVNLIAGQSIHLFPGTLIQPGAYVHAYITTDGSFCDFVNSSILDIKPIIAKSIDNLYQVEKANYLIEQPSIKLYPNPNNGRFTIEISNFKDGAKVFVYNMLGGLVYNSTLINMEINNVNLPEIERGLYLIKVVGKNELLVKKILIN